MCLHEVIFLFVLVASDFEVEGFNEGIPLPDSKVVSLLPSFPGLVSSGHVCFSAISKETVMGGVVRTRSLITDLISSYPLSPINYNTNSSSLIKYVYS